MLPSFRSVGQAGFTPIEALIASAAGLIAVAAFASFNSAQMYTMRGQANQVDLQTTARNIVDLFAREVRRAGTGTNPNCTGTVSTGVLAGTSSMVQIKADVNNDGVLTGSSEPNENVIYTLDILNNQVLRTDYNRTSVPDTLWSGVTIGGISPLSGGTSAIAGSQILYWDSNGNPLVPGTSGLTATQLKQVVRIKLELALAVTSTQPGNSMVLTAQDSATVDIRNRYFAMASPCGPQPQTSPLTFYR